VSRPKQETINFSVNNRKYIIRPNSPRTIEACKQLGIVKEDLVKKTPKMAANSKKEIIEMEKSYYEFKYIGLFML